MGQMLVADPERVGGEFLEIVAGLGTVDPAVRVTAKARPFGDDDAPARQDDTELFEDEDDLDDGVVDWP